MNKVAIVAKREYLKNIKKKSFWVATLMFPLIFVASIFISTLSAKTSEDKIKKEKGT